MIIFLLGLAAMLLLMIKAKLDLFMSMLLGDLIIDMGCGVGSSETIDTLTGSFGNTCRNIGLVIILGTILGTYLEKSNSCQRITTSLPKVTGEKDAGATLAAAGCLVLTLVFSDVVFIMLSPIIRAVSKKTGGVLCVFTTLTAYALSYTDAYVAPMPTPLAAAAVIGLDMGISITHGLAVAAVSTVTAGLFCILFLDKKPADYFVSTDNTSKKEAVATSVEEPQIPSFIETVLPILIPIILIVVSSTCGMALAKGSSMLAFTGFVGDKDITLVIDITSTILLLEEKLPEGETFEATGDALKTTGPVIFITTVDGALTKMADATRAGQVFAGALAASFLPVILVLFLITASSRFAQGSGSVAALLGVSSSIPLIEAGLMNPVAAFISISADSHCNPHMNNGFSQVFAGFFGYDTKTTLKILYVAQDVMLAGAGLLCVWAISVVQNLMEVKKMSNFRLKRVIPPMVTPFREDGGVDYGAFIHNVEKWSSTGLADHLVLGSNSETCYLDGQEKEGLVRLTVEHAADGKFVVAGTGLEPTRQTIELTNRAASLGVKGALILTPCFFGSSMDDNALIDYFIQVANHMGIPVLLYNASKLTYVNIKADTVQKLTSHPSVFGVKDGSGSVLQLAAYRRVTPNSFNVVVGAAGTWYPILTLGIEVGAHMLANCYPSGCAKIQELFDEEDWEGARDLYQRMFLVGGVMTGTYGIIGLKYGCDLMGYKGGHVRGPLQSLADEEKTALRDIFGSVELLQRATAGGCSPIDKSVAIELEDKVTIKFSSLGTQPMPLNSWYHLCCIQIRT